MDIKHINNQFGDKIFKLSKTNYDNKIIIQNISDEEIIDKEMIETINEINKKINENAIEIENIKKLIFEILEIPF